MQGYHKNSCGFSLIELMIVVVIVAVLAGIATPLYMNYMEKVKRSDAISALGKMALAEESYKLDNGTYTGTLSDIWTGSASEEGLYVLSVNMLDSAGSVTTIQSNATGFELQADPTGAQISDTECDPIILRVNGGQISKSPSACWV